MPLTDQLLKTNELEFGVQLQAKQIDNVKQVNFAGNIFL